MASLSLGIIILCIIGFGHTGYRIYKLTVLKRLPGRKEFIEAISIDACIGALSLISGILYNIPASINLGILFLLMAGAWTFILYNKLYLE